MSYINEERREKKNNYLLLGERLSVEEREFKPNVAHYVIKGGERT